MRKLVLFFFISSFYYAGGQSVQPHAYNSLDSAAGLYFSNQDETLPIHNGRVFYGYPGMTDHAFYPSVGWQTGSILHDGIWYRDVSLMYDVHKDELITLHPNTTHVRLFTERVQQFSFGNVSFVRLNADKDGVVSNALYQRLVNGNVTIFVRRVKKVDKKIVDQGIERKFVSQDQYYVFKDGIYSHISKQKSLLNLLKESRQSILRHLKQQGLKFKKDREQTIVQIAEFYNQSHR